MSPPAIPATWTSGFWPDGRKKDTDNISLKQMIEGIKKADGSILDSGTGLSKPTVTKAVKSLVEKNVIIATRRRRDEKGDESTTYTLNVIGDPVLKNLTRGGQERQPTTNSKTRYI